MLKVKKPNSVTAKKSKIKYARVMGQNLPVRSVDEKDLPEDPKNKIARIEEDIKANIIDQTDCDYLISKKLFRNAVLEAETFFASHIKEYARALHELAVGVKFVESKDGKDIIYAMPPCRRSIEIILNRLGGVPRPKDSDSPNNAGNATQVVIMLPPNSRESVSLPTVDGKVIDAG